MTHFASQSALAAKQDLAALGVRAIHTALRGKLPLWMEMPPLEEGAREFRIMADGIVAVRVFAAVGYVYGKANRYVAVGAVLGDRGSMYRRVPAQLAKALIEKLAQISNVKRVEARIAECLAAAKEGRRYKGWVPTGDDPAARWHSLDALAIEAYLSGFRSADEDLNQSVETRLAIIAKSLSNELWFWLLGASFGPEMEAAVRADAAGKRHG